MSDASANPWDIPPDWPAPEPSARALSARLLECLAGEIAAADGFLGFDRYMDLVLYAPGLGYYSAGSRKFGAQGDFVTAPEVSPLFSRCLARSCASVLTQLGGGDILELGAGTGRMAVDLLRELDAQGALPAAYRILERSADLRQRQQALLQHELPGLAGRVQWLDAPPAENWRGVLLANEVLDALPVMLFGWSRRRVVERGIAWRDGRLAWDERPASAEVQERVNGWSAAFGWSDDYRSELRPALAAWLHSVTETLAAGAALFVDYGYARHEYYSAERARGTLLCHYRQRAHPDPLLLPGLQDITAHVDFTGVAEAASEQHWRVSGYATQAHFLLDCGIERMLAERLADGDAAYLRLASQAKTLLLPGEMGERFKAMLLSRGIDAPVPGFGLRDLRGRL